jgi:hypothetical protein
MSTPAPRSWTVSEVTASLERLGFSVHPPLQGSTDGLDSIAGLLAAPPTEQDCLVIQKWLDERRDAFNEDLARILLGDFGEGEPDTPAACVEDFVRRGRPLLVELTQCARELQGDGGGRIREIAAELAELFQLLQARGSLEPQAREVLLPLAGDPPAAAVARYQDILQNQQIDLGGRQDAA